MAEPVLTALGSFPSLPAVTAAGQGVIVAERRGLGLATVLARRGQTEALAERLRDLFGLDLPQGPRRGTARDVAFAGIGPGAWLAVAEAGGHAFAASLRHAIGDLASISDQSDGYAVLRLAGPKVRDVLAKGVALDLHASRFRPADVAVTSVAHIGTTLWRLDDSADGSAVYEIVVFRSLAGSFWHWLSDSAAEFGIGGVEPGRG